MVHRALCYTFPFEKEIHTSGWGNYLKVKCLLSFFFPFNILKCKSIETIFYSFIFLHAGIFPFPIPKAPFQSNQDMQLYQQYCSEAKVPLPWCGPSMWKIDACAVSLTLSFCLFLYVPKCKLIPGEQMQQCLVHMYIADLALRTLLSMTCPFYNGILPGLCCIECGNGFPPGHSPLWPSLHPLLLRPWLHSHLKEGRVRSVSDMSGRGFPSEE